MGKPHRQRKRDNSSLHFEQITTKGNPSLLASFRKVKGSPWCKLPLCCGQLVLTVAPGLPLGHCVARALGLTTQGWKRGALTTTVLLGKPSLNTSLPGLSETRDGQQGAAPGRLWVGRQQICHLQTNRKPKAHPTLSTI